MSDGDGNNVLMFPIIDGYRFKSVGFSFRCYTLVNRIPVLADDHIEWAEAMAKRWRTARENGVDPWRVDATGIVSTVFLGIDHRFYGEGPPILFETMIFGGSLNAFQNRCCTWHEAELMHAEAVRQVRAGKLKGGNNG